MFRFSGLKSLMDLLYSQEGQDHIPSAHIPRAKQDMPPTWDINQAPTELEYKFHNAEEISVKESYSSSPSQTFPRAFTHRLLIFHTTCVLFKSQEVLTIRAVSALLLSLGTGLAQYKPSFSSLRPLDSIKLVSK